jgi:ABC-2 type transport system permease protein
VENVRVAFVDYDKKPLGREIEARVDASPAFRVVHVGDREADAERLIDDGTAEMVVVLPYGAQRAMARRESVTIPVWVDGTDTNRGLLAQGYLQEVLFRVAQDRQPPIPIALPAHADLRVRVLYNPALQSRWFMLPAIVVMVLSVITTLLSALAIVKEREKGTIEQLVVTPIRPIELILGKLLPFVLVGAIIATLVTIFAVAIFGIPFRGNPAELFGMAVLYLLSMLGVGLFVSTVSRTQQQAMLSAILVLLPSFLLGGVFYPVSNMPDWAQSIAALSPIRYFVVMVRGVFLKGIGFEVLSWEASRLLLIGAVVLGVSILRFRKRSA